MAVAWPANAGSACAAAPEPQLVLCHTLWNEVEHVRDQHRIIALSVVESVESADRDRRLDTLVAYTEALGADLLLALRVGDRVIDVSRPDGTRIALVHELTFDAFDTEPTSLEPASLESLDTDGAQLDDAAPLILELAA